MKIENTIETDKIYLSEVMSELPSNIILNKGVTGCGGTYVELHSKRNSIILVPTIELAKNKTKPGYLIVHGKVKENKIIEYLSSDIKYKKIIGTYDSLKKLLSISDELLDYFLLIDEYHILFNSYSFRNEAILYILENYNKFNNYCFMTATPLDDTIILKQIEELPRLNINWSNSVNIKLDILNVSFTNKELIKLISKEDNVNYHIFLNSVKTIKDIVTKTGISNYKIVCSETSRNNNKTLKMGTTLDPVCKYNFYTSTAFEGCDIFDPIGKTIILCDTSISSTILDISTLVRQICGRLRDSQYKNDITLILNTNKHRYAGTSEEMFKLQVEENAKLGVMTSERFQNDSEDFKKAELIKYNFETYSNIYLNNYDDIIFYDVNLQRMDEYNYKLVSSIYNNTISVIMEASKHNIEVSKIVSELSWVEKKLRKQEYSYDELEEIFTEDFKNKGLVFNGYTIKDYFPPFEKIRRVKNKIKKTYYKFKI